MALWPCGPPPPAPRHFLCCRGAVQHETQLAEELQRAEDPQNLHNLAESEEPFTQSVLQCLVTILFLIRTINIVIGI